VRLLDRGSGTDDATAHVMILRIEEIVELLILVAHRSRIAFEDSCNFEDAVAHEILLLRALSRRGTSVKGRDLARALGWSPGRVTQVVDVLVSKQQVERRPGLSVTGPGACEAEQGAYLLRDVAEKILDGFDEEERAMVVRVLRRLAANSEALWRIKRIAS
jgi:DNA-binding MarR family transcriptional regulator